MLIKNYICFIANWFIQACTKSWFLHSNIIEKLTFFNGIACCYLQWVTIVIGNVGIFRYSYMTEKHIWWQHFLGQLYAKSLVFFSFFKSLSALLVWWLRILNFVKFCHFGSVPTSIVCLELIVTLFFSKFFKKIWKKIRSQLIQGYSCNYMGMNYRAT